MRNDQDIVRLSLSLTGEVEIDLERLEGDPVWRSIKSTGVEDEPGLVMYIQHYVAVERLFRYMPCTNGPGGLTLLKIEEINNACR